MSLKFKTLEEFTQSFLENCLVEVCMVCKEEKPIPMTREEKRCDECVEELLKSLELKEKQEAAERRKIAQRIPERYRVYDMEKMEILQSDLEYYCQPGRSLAISGEVGTGKTSLACKVLAVRKVGYFYTANEMTMRIAERIQAEKLLVIDDITEVNSTDEKKVEALRQIFHFRYNEQLDTIVTLSKSYEEFQRIFGSSGEALVSRFRQWTFPVVLKKKWR